MLASYTENMLWYLIVLVLKFDVITIHSFQNNLQGREKVPENDGSVVVPLRLGETRGVYKLHLFQDG